MKRREFAVFLHNSFRISEVIPSSSVKPLDIERDSTEYEAITLLVHKGIFSLNEQGEFEPNRYVNRAEAITAIVRISGLSIENGSTRELPFWDISKNYWAKPYVQTAYQNKLIAKSSSFHPKKILTRAQLMAMVSKTPSPYCNPRS